MRRIIVVGVAVLAGLLAPAAASATSVSIDTIVYEQSGGVNPGVYSATADFSLSGNLLTIVLRNTSSGLSGGQSSTNLLVGLAFNLPGSVEIANDASANGVSLSPGSTSIGGSLGDSTWGAATGSIASINNLTGALGGVNAGISTLQSQTDFGLDGGSPASVDGPAYGILSSSVPGSGAGGLAAFQDSLTFSLLLSAKKMPSNLIKAIDDGLVVASFGSPDTLVGDASSPVPEPGTLALLTTALVVGFCYRRAARRA